MIRVSELSGAWLDYWVARAEGWEAGRLEIRPVPRTNDLICVLLRLNGSIEATPFSTQWRLAGPIIERERPELVPTWPDGGWYVRSRHRPCDGDQFYGETAMVAAMRAFVASKFGEEVPEVKP